jgi:hypothetical protein
MRYSTIGGSPFHAKVWSIVLIVLVMPACCKLMWYHSTIHCCNSFGTQTFLLKVVTSCSLMLIVMTWSLNLLDKMRCCKALSFCCALQICPMLRGKLLFDSLSRLLMVKMLSANFGGVLLAIGSQLRQSCCFVLIIDVDKGGSKFRLTNILACCSLRFV